MDIFDKINSNKIVNTVKQFEQISETLYSDQRAQSAKDTVDLFSFIEAVATSYCILLSEIVINSLVNISIPSM